VKLDRLVNQLVDAALDECAIETFWHNPFPNVGASRKHIESILTKFIFA
jgi:hypothetical protein